VDFAAVSQYMQISHRQPQVHRARISGPLALLSFALYSSLFLRRPFDIKRKASTDYQNS
jgi:hypothetical protein